MTFLPPAMAPGEELLHAARELDKVYVTSRYPNGFVSGSPDQYFDEASSRILISYARGILEFCRGRMP